MLTSLNNRVIGLSSSELDCTCAQRLSGLKSLAHMGTCSVSELLLEKTLYLNTCITRGLYARMLSSSTCEGKSDKLNVRD